MAAVEELPAEPMEVVDTIDDLDDMLSTADNLAEALETNAVRVKNQKNSIHESKGDNCAIKSDRNKTNTANEKNQSIVPLPDVLPTNGLADGIVHADDEDEPVIETIDLDDEDEVESGENDKKDKIEGAKVENGNVSRDGSSEDNSMEHMDSVENGVPSEEIEKDITASEAPQQKLEVENEPQNEENADITNISSETENHETINLDSDIEEMEQENVKCDLKEEAKNTSSVEDVVQIVENDTKECSTEKDAKIKEPEHNPYSAYSFEVDEESMDNPSQAEVAENDSKVEAAPPISNANAEIEDHKSNCADGNIETIDLELETIDLDSETEKEEPSKPEVNSANGEASISECETTVKSEEIPPDIKNLKTTSPEPEPQLEEICHEEKKDENIEQEVDEPRSGVENEEKSERSQALIEETINLDSDTESQLGDENVEQVTTASTDKDTDAQLLEPNTNELEDDVPESEDHQPASKELEISHKLIDELDAKEPEDLEAASNELEISDKPIEEFDAKESKEDEIPDVIETGLEMTETELENNEKGPENKKESEVELEVHSVNAVEESVEMKVDPVDTQEESVDVEIVPAAAEKAADKANTEQLVAEAKESVVKIEVNLIEVEAETNEAEAVPIEKDLSDAETKLIETEPDMNKLRPEVTSPDSDVKKVQLDSEVILDENETLKVETGDFEEQLESVKEHSATIEIKSETKPMESDVKSLESEPPKVSENTTSSVNPPSDDCKIQDEPEYMEIDLIDSPNFDLHTETEPHQLKAPLVAEEEKTNEQPLATISATVFDEELKNVLPVSPRVIELLDDDDEDIEPPPKRFAGEPKKETEICDRMQPGPSHCSKHEISDDRKEESMQNETPEPVTAVETKESKTEVPVATNLESDSVSDSDDCVFYGKECINFECERKNTKKFYKAPGFVLNFYKTQRKNKLLFVCDDCFNSACVKYKDLVGALVAHKPLLEQDIPKRQDFVEILDSSDEDEDPGEVKMDDEQRLGAKSIDLLRNELDNAICDITKRVDLNKQVEWSRKILSDRLSKMEVECQEISDNLKQLQKSADTMHSALYQCPKIKIKELPALDLNTGRPYSCESEYTVPPLGELKYPAIEINSTYFAVRNKAIASWLPCRVIESMDVSVSGQKSVKYFKVKYLKIKIPTIKCVSAKHMAYGDAPNVRLSIGTRIIALFDGSTLSKSSKEVIAPNAFYPGIIAEQLQAYNKYRYLIFFDDGYAQYVHHKDVRVVCQAAENVWEDVHPASRDFIHNYLSQYQKHRPMVQVKKGQSMITESNGKWLYAKVVDVDASLVQMQFEGQNRYEWIYRGSTRLGPLFKEKQSNGTAAQPASFPRRTEPYVRYDEEAIRNDAVQQQAVVAEKQAARAVARKSTATTTSRQDSQSTTSSQGTVKHLNNSIIFLEDDNRPKGKVVYYTTRKNLPPKSYVPHECKPSCLFTITHNLHSYSPLAKPLLSGWERQIFKSKLKKSVVYRGPCGRRIRNMEELHRYLRLTKNVLNVDNFDFDCAIHCLAEYVIDSSIVSKPDISNGIENMAIPCVNYYDSTFPPYCEYSLERIPTEGVKMNLDPAFLAGCDCEDDCLDKSKCSCWQLTLAGARFGNANTPPENIGYSFKRLLEQVPTGVYECNANCKCSKNCLNRVVQNPLEVKLQLFKTSSRGWGLRCLNDIPKGTFICIYAGHLLTEQKANEGGVNASDEYFAELDYIEVVERLKEGYESDVQEENESEDEEFEEPNPDADSDEDFRSKCSVEKDGSINTRLRTRRSTTDDDKKRKKKTIDEDSEERQVINFEPNTSLGNEEQTALSTKYKSIRKYFGKNEFCYVMDAKKTGNIGRYFNHSCAPNLFVQNVFVDTQDLRFPWVAFFALSHIRAGTELTWNYNYEVGIVPGKVLYCECGAPNCRGRLL